MSKSNKLRNFKTFKDYRQGNLKPIWESKGMLDISIQDGKKYLNSQSKKEEFLSTELKVYAKYDGVKVTIVKINNTGRAEEDYLVAYKNNLIFPDEFEFVSKAHIKKKSISSSQFAFVWDHLKKLKKNSIPVGTELFVEYLMRKPTLSSKYTKLHGMILIGYSKSSYQIKGTKLFTKPSGFFTEKREKYAQEMKLGYPELLFEGKIYPKENFLRGIKNEYLLGLYRERSDLINWDDKEEVLKEVIQMFLDIPSRFGGKEEGVVVQLKGPKKTIIKFQQSYQVDQSARAKIKAQFRGDIEEETQYWENVHRVVEEIFKKLKISTSSNSSLSKEGVEGVHKVLQKIAKFLKTYEPDFTHSKKDKDQIKEDIQLSAKMLLSKKVDNAAMVIGKFRVLQKAHYKIIKDALKNYDNVTIAIISSKDTKGTKQLRNNVIENCFRKEIQEGKLEIINSSSGNLITLMNKSKHDISTIIAGSDRVESYQNQLKKSKGVEVQEIKRTDEGISATKIIDNLDDIDYFKNNTPSCVWKFYDDYLKVYRG